jgi:hypothetical protein
MYQNATDCVEINRGKKTFSDTVYMLTQTLCRLAPRPPALSVFPPPL